jgi:hypothetical protein
VAAALLAASAIAASAASAREPDGSWRAFTQPGAVDRILGGSWIELEVASVAPAPFAGTLPLGASAPRLGLAGATLRNLDGWSASLFVSRAFADPGAAASVRFADATAVNARLSRRLSGTTSVTLDLFNLLDRREAPLDAFVASNLWSAGGVPDDFLVHPGEPRGVRIGIRRTFR